MVCLMCDRAGAWGVGGVPSSGGVFFPFLLLACVSKPLRWKGKLGKGKGLLVQWNANMLKGHRPKSTTNHRLEAKYNLRICVLKG